MSTPELLAETDKKRAAEVSLLSYFKYVFQMVARKGFGLELIN